MVLSTVKTGPPGDGFQILFRPIQPRRAGIELNAMDEKASEKSTEVEKKAVAKGSGAKPVLLSGGNPQIAKADGDAPVQAYIAAMPGWKSDLGSRLDALIAREVPNVRKAVRWNSPFYGIEGQGWFVSYHVFRSLRKGDLLPRCVAGTRSTRLRQGQGRALDQHLRGRTRRRADGRVDQASCCPARLGWVQTLCKLNAESSRRPIEGSFGFFIGEEVRDCTRQYAAKCPRNPGHFHRFCTLTYRS